MEEALGRKTDPVTESPESEPETESLEPVTERPVPVERPVTERRRTEWPVTERSEAERRRVEAERRRVEAEREARMEKAEVQADRMKSRRQVQAERMKSRRQMTRRTVEMDEDRMEAEMAKAKRAEAKRAELELESDTDEQRREAEVAGLERFLVEFEREKAEMELKMEAEKKRVDEGIEIFKVWWAASLQAQEQGDREEGEDFEWLKTWALRRPLASTSVWREWESDEDLFIELYDSVCGEKMKELRLNSWKKVEVFQQELEDVELMTYCNNYIDFRNCWENKYSNQHGQFEDISK